MNIQSKDNSIDIKIDHNIDRDTERVWLCNKTKQMEGINIPLMSISSNYQINTDMKQI